MNMFLVSKMFSELAFLIPLGGEFPGLMHCQKRQRIWEALKHYKAIKSYKSLIKSKITNNIYSKRHFKQMNWFIVDMTQNTQASLL